MLGRGVMSTPAEMMTRPLARPAPRRSSTVGTRGGGPWDYGLPPPPPQAASAAWLLRTAVPTEDTLRWGLCPTTSPPRVGQTPGGAASGKRWLALSLPPGPGTTPAFFKPPHQRRLSPLRGDKLKTSKSRSHGTRQGRLILRLPPALLRQQSLVIDRVVQGQIKLDRTQRKVVTSEYKGARGNIR